VNHANVSGSTALIEACYRGHVEAVATLLTAGADPNAADVYGYTALLAVAGTDDPDELDILELLLARSVVDINHTNNDGYSALALAARYYHDEVVDKLLTLGVDRAPIDSAVEAT
jgi:uncharacterized protein